MQTIKTFFILFLAFFALNNAYSQGFLDKIKKKVTQATTTEESNKTAKEPTPDQIKQLIEEKKMTYAMTYSDQGMTSETHKKYVGKVVFSNSEIQFKKENESQFKTTVNIEDPLFLQYYLERSIGNEVDAMFDLGANPDFNAIVIYVNGEPKVEWGRASWLNPGNDRNQWTTNGYPLATDDTDKQGISCLSYLKAVSGLPVGTYNIKIEMSLIALLGRQTNEQLEYKAISTPPSHITKIKNVVASGEFTLKITSQGKAAFLQKYAIKPPKAGQANPALEKDMLALVGKKAIKAIIFTPKWEFAKNDIGLITHRYVYGLVIEKSDDGTCQGTVYEFGQPKGDGNNYGSTFINGVAGYSEWSKEYTCEAVK